MAQAKKCDICKKYYDVYNTTTEVNSTRKNANTLRFVVKGGVAKICVDEFDCCPECMGAINDLIDELKK